MTPGKFLLGTLFVCYPLIVYLLLDELGPALLGGGLIVMLLARSGGLVALQLARGGAWQRRLPALAWGLAALAVIAVALFILDDTALALKMYPSLINFSLLIAFAYTLYRPPSMIEHIARAARIRPSSRTGPYTRILTMIWCGFFAVNGIITTAIAASGSLGAWTVYNGLISYLAAGALIVGELIFRHFYKRRHGLTAEQA